MAKGAGTGRVHEVEVAWVDEPSRAELDGAAGLIGGLLAEVIAGEPPYPARRGAGRRT